MMNHDILVPLAGIALPMILVPTILAFRHMAKKREFQHRERMRSLETGRSMPGESIWPQAFVCAAVGAGVPVGAFFFTFLAWISSSHTPGEIWLAPVVVSLAALMSSKVMALSLFRMTNHETAMEAKPAFDPDAYDVVGSRG